MANKTISTRLRLLCKSYSDWNTIKDTFIPLQGEMCIVMIPSESTETQPTVLFKVGDGEHKFSELPYSSALAADVYDWAKKASLNWSDIDDAFKTSLGEFIDEHYAHENTLYQIVSDGDFKWKLQKSEDGGSTWVDATGSIDVSSIDQKITDLDNSLAAIAKTGNVNDLVQTEGDYLILDCNI